MTTPFSHQLRIYWEDTDAGGVVFYANYLKYFERARTEWLRARGFEQEALRSTARVVLVVTEARLSYRRPARLDDELRVTVDRCDVGRASLEITQVAWRGDERLVEGDIRIGCVDADTFKPRRLPGDLLERIAAVPRG